MGRHRNSRQQDEQEVVSVPSPALLGGQQPVWRYWYGGTVAAALNVALAPAGTRGEEGACGSGTEREQS